MSAQGFSNQVLIALKSEFDCSSDLAEKAVEKASSKLEDMYYSGALVMEAADTIYSDQQYWSE